MLAIAISNDFLADDPATQPVTVELSAADRDVLRRVVDLLGDPSVAHPAATLAALVRWLASAEDVALCMELAARHLALMSRGGGLARVVDLGVRL